MSQTTYKTKEGDRWDSIAAVVYSDSLKATELINANPTVPLRVVLPAGITINVPILTETQSQSLNLPPWKR